MYKDFLMDAAVELYERYRPKCLDDVVGQDAAVSQLRSWLNSKTVPHVILFSGPRGCGKTSLARIMRLELGCTSRSDFLEINAADQRGVDDVRNLIMHMDHSPTAGPSRVAILDECFPGSTPVNLPNGRVSCISNLQKGDCILSLAGLSLVERVFQNAVPLHRLIRLHLSDGTSLVTTKEHLFLTRDGWVEAVRLEGCHVPRKNLSLVQTTLRQQNAKPPTEMLLQKLRWKVTTARAGQWSFRHQKVPILQKEVPIPSSRFRCRQDILLPILSSKGQDNPSRVSGQILVEGGPGENQQILKRKASSGILREDEDKQSFLRSRRRSTNTSNQGTKRDTSQMVGDKGGKRNLYKRRKETVVQPMQTAELGDVLCCLHKSRDPLSSQLQIGSGKQETSTRCGSGWAWTQIEEEYLAGCEEGGSSPHLRVDCVEVYQPGCNDSSFLGVVSDQDRRRGFAIFYDVQVSGHPSYFVNGIAVHNCHQYTSEAQSALLKVLEPSGDTPKSRREWAFYLLCTTEPEKLKTTVRDRCANVQVKTMSHMVLRGLLKRVCDQEIPKKPLPSTVVDQLVDYADGSARRLLTGLHDIIGLKNTEDMLAILVPPKLKEDAFNLARILMGWTRGAGWSDCQKILNELETNDVEGFRRMILSAATTAISKAETIEKARRAAIVINAFRYDFYSVGMAGFYEACFTIFDGGK